MAATFNSLESMGEEITDERLVSNNDIEEMLKVLKKQHPENEKFFEDCLDELKKNQDVFNTMTLEDIQAVLNKLQPYIKCMISVSKESQSSLILKRY